MVLGFLRRRGVKKLIDRAIEDGKLTSEEMQTIEIAGTAAGLDTDAIINAMVERVRPVAQKLMDALVAKVMATREFSDDDEAGINAVFADLRIGTPPDLTALMPFRALWQARNGLAIDLPEVGTAALLRPDERCFLDVDSEWRQMKTVRENRGYASAGLSVRIARGVYIRSGRSVPVGSVTEQLVPVSSGRLVVTDRRMIFQGTRRSLETKFGAITGIAPYSDAIEISKARGAPDVYMLAGIADIAVVEAAIRAGAG